MNFDARPQKQIMSKVVVSRAIALLDRFDFAAITLHRVLFCNYEIHTFFQFIGFNRRPYCQNLWTDYSHEIF